jgi:hypothetical protein
MSAVTNAASLIYSRPGVCNTLRQLDYKREPSFTHLFMEELQVCIECDTRLICRQFCAGWNYFQRTGFLQQTREITDGVTWLPKGPASANGVAIIFSVSGPPSLLSIRYRVFFHRTHCNRSTKRIIHLTLMPRYSLSGTLLPYLHCQVLNHYLFQNIMFLAQKFVTMYSAGTLFDSGSGV